ncbi:putative importin-5 [Iris pallida]|uniref:Importin-5 n=1 Tax=Iris pallida TaxID=29817 RepID=A0AAX6EA52_IRIPA|nr:putative importin-5 [Iris pallida]
MVMKLAMFEIDIFFYVQLIIPNIARLPCTCSGSCCNYRDNVTLGGENAKEVSKRTFLDSLKSSQAAV